MRTLLTRLLIVLAACSLAVLLRPDASRADSALKIEPMVWQINRDYPDGTPIDSSLPIDTVYIKTHDGTDWMSTYDSHPWAVSGPAAIQNLINVYGEQGIQVAAWFVPTGSDYDTQLQMAEQVIDSGVTALYADIEPFSGFCNQNCGALADNFWSRLRAERPNARLGTIYDPRLWWWDASATSRWLSNSNVAMPMCYWDDFVGQVPYGDPEGCVAQGKADLAVLAPGKALEYLPVLQGNSSADKFQRAMDAAVRAEATRVSIWRRGVTSDEVWDTIAGYQAPSGPHCALRLVDGCVVTEAFLPPTYLIEGGAKLLIDNPGDLDSLGLTERDVQTLPANSLKDIPDAPADGTLLTDGSGAVYVIYGGARFLVPPEEFDSLGLNPAGAKTVAPGILSQLPLAPRDYVRVQQIGDPIDYLVLHGARIPMDADGEASLVVAGHGGSTLYRLPTGGLDQIPLAQLLRGDADCDGTVGILDVIHVLQRSIGVADAAVCLHVVGDVTCDGWPAATDALKILRYVAGAPEDGSPDCPPVGEAEPAALPAHELAALEATPSPGPARSDSSTPTDSPLPTP